MNEQLTYVIDLEHDRVVVFLRWRGGGRSVRLALPLSGRCSAGVGRDLVTDGLERLGVGHDYVVERGSRLGVVGRDELEELALDVVGGRVLALDLLLILDLEVLLQAPAREVELLSAVSHTRELTLISRSR